VSKIDKLTAAQIAKFPGYVREWTAIGLSTEPADRKRAEAAIRKMYECGGLKPPRNIVWCGSPMSNALTRSIVMDERFGAALRAALGQKSSANGAKIFGQNVWDSVGHSVGASVGASVWASVGASVRASVGASVWASVKASVGASVGASVWASVGDSVWASVGDSVRHSVGGSVYGQHDANWLAFYRFFQKECGLIEETKKLEGLSELCLSAGWAIPHENICWVSERHCVCCRDERGRLHNTTGAALAYPDGWSIYAVHGVRLPERIILHPETIKVAEIESEKNAEVRRVMTERYSGGLAGYLKDSGAKEVHSDDYGTLYRKEVPNDEPIVAVSVINASPEPDGQYRNYILRVPPQITTARAAVAWSFGKKEAEYDPEVQT